MVRTKEQKENIRRAIVILVLGIIVALFLTFNAGPEGFGAGVLYTIMGSVTILGYLVWDRF